jgi:hypothetical protein
MKSMTKKMSPEVIAIPATNLMKWSNSLAMGVST